MLSVRSASFLNGAWQGKHRSPMPERGRPTSVQNRYSDFGGSTFPLMSFSGDRLDSDRRRDEKLCRIALMIKVGEIRSRSRKSSKIR